MTPPKVQLNVRTLEALVNSSGCRHAETRKAHERRKRSSRLSCERRESCGVACACERERPWRSDLKKRVKAEGKRDDVTALLLYVKGQPRSFAARPTSSAMAASITMSRAYSLAAPRAAAAAPRASAIRAAAAARTPATSAATAGTVTARTATSKRALLTVVRAAPEQPVAPMGNASISMSCSIDDPGSCSVADLEMMYVDALWNYYNGGTFTMSNEDYDNLRNELNWQGSGFPTLRRYEVEFVSASLSYARGEPIVSDEKYEDLKKRVKAEGKRDDVTALLLYVKGQQLLDPEQYARLSGEMKKLGIEIGLRGATCTLSKTSPELTSDVGTLSKAYLALATIPTLIGLVPFLGATLIGADVPPAFGLGFAAFFSIALTSKLLEYTGLQNGEILVGECPCCETPIKQFFSGEKPKDVFAYKCSVCGTECDLDRNRKLIVMAGGLKSA
eukprot:CAMPEP_0197615596 /NCGR_PEP_ID=MMETSP1326-20131121/60106_1 /TAXON_ID=1155430 /ORGANISM="Genus nov. species nov., Strain RCC2288" /LENGTH=446 /DNA_ID=CAMNT_0043184477 /DNA_START=110 /DNA_END=1451 /DNA_ORIENTATION=+